MTAALEDYATAQKMREIITRLVKQQINAQRPDYRYATVQAIDRPNRKVFVVYPGETDVIPVNMGSIEPSSVGQTVRIAGRSGDRYLADVIGTPYVLAPGTDPAYVNVTTFDALGDLIVGTGNDSYSKLTVGANNTVLTADSTAPGGVKWAAPATVTLTAGTGITVGTGPNYTVTNTGVLSVGATGNLSSTGGQNPSISISATPSFTSATIPTLTGAVNVTGNLSENGSRVYSANNPNLASAVVSETSYGQSAAVGAGTDYARGNHTHGTPATPVTSLAVTNNASVNASTGAVTITNSLTPTFTSVTVTSGGISASSDISTSANVIGNNVYGRSAVYAIPAAGGNGYSGLAPGSGTVSGYLGLWGPNGNRIGYIGSSTNAAASDQGTINYVATAHAFSGYLTLSAIRGIVDMQTAGGVSTFKFDPTITNADGFTGAITLPQGSINGSALLNGSVPYSKLSASAQAVIAVTNPDTTFGFLRSATSATADANGYAVGNLTSDASASRVSDGLAYDGQALKGTSGTTTNGAYVVKGPFYGFISNTGIADNLYPNQGYGLKPGDYQAQVYMRVSSAAPTTACAIIDVADAAGEITNMTPLTVTPSLLASTNYVAVTVPFTVTATSRSTTAGNGVQVRVQYQTAAAVDVYVSHVVVSPYVTGQGEITTTYIRDLAVTNAKINDLAVNKLTAGSITTDDIQIGAGGRIYIGASKTATTRMEWVASGFYSYVSGVQTVGLTNTGGFQLRSAASGTRINVDSAVGLELYNGATRTFFADVSTGNLSMTGSLTGASSIQIGTTGFGVDTSGNMFMGASSFAAATAFKVSNAGALTATSGTIAGWSINSANFKSPSLRLQLDSGANFIAAFDSTLTKYVALRGASGDTKMLQVFDGTADTFSVTTAGVVTMTGATINGNTTISGTLSVTSSTTLGSTLTLGASGVISVGSTVTLNGTGTSTIGGWTISSTQISKNSLVLDSSGYISAGTVGGTYALMDGRSGVPSGYYFSAYKSGALAFGVDTSGNVTMSGATITGSNISVGTSTATSKISTNGDLWMGAVQPLGLDRIPTSAPTMTTATTGGSIPAGTYWYVVQHVNADGIPGPYKRSASSQTTTGSTSTVTVSWANTVRSGRYDTRTGTIRVLRYTFVSGVASAYTIVGSGLSNTATSFVDTVASGSTTTTIANQTLPGFFWDGSTGLGSVLKSGISGRRLEIDGGATGAGEIRFYSGLAGEELAAGGQPGHITTVVGSPNSTSAYLVIESPVVDTRVGYTSAIQLISSDPSSAQGLTQIQMLADTMQMPNMDYGITAANVWTHFTQENFVGALKYNGRNFPQGISGSAGVTTDASGNWTVTHNLGTAGHSIAMLSNFGAANGFNITSRTSTTSGGNMRRIDTNAQVASTGSTFFYLVAPA